MSRHSLPSRLGVNLLLIASVVGLGLSLHLYLTPMTGVTGTFGALLVSVSSALLVLAGVVLAARTIGGIATSFRILALLGVLGTLAAAFFLHGWWLMVAMAVALVGIVLEFIRPKGVTT